MSKKFSFDNNLLNTAIEFIELLTTTYDPDVNENPILLIPNRDGDVFDSLLSQLMDEKRKDLPKQLEKLFVVFLGRNLKGEKVWCNGNPMRGDISRFRTFCTLIGGDLSVCDIFDTIRASARHQYRDSDIPNRHGHCNSFPSWWARGYNSLHGFYLAEPEECLEYCKKRGIIKSLEDPSLWVITECLDIIFCVYDDLFNDMFKKYNFVQKLKPDYVAPLVAWLCHESCQENGSVFELGAGWIAKLRWQRAKGVAMNVQSFTPEVVRDNWEKICDFSEHTFPSTTSESMGQITELISKL